MWCAEPWCYISDECTLYDDQIESSIFDGFVYSYNKCGGDVNGSADEAEVDNEDDQENNDDGEGNQENNDDGEGSADNGDVVYENCECLTEHGLELNEDGEFVVIYQGVQYPYDANYGLNECAAWDQDLGPFCLDNAQDFCTAQWCYVSNDCTAPDTTPSNVEDSNISYSYQVCGDVADFPDNDEIDNNDGGADAGEGADDGEANGEAGENGEDGNADAGEADGEEDADVAAGEADEAEACEESCGQNDVNINISFNVDA